MVDMVPGSEKLVTRAKGMVAAIAGVPPARAATIWEEAGGSVKVAVLMLDGLKRAEAEARLTAVDGRLDRARNTNPPD
jgi:N-acetylmuramic acid 6-phosphate etherase